MPVHEDTMADVVTDLELDDCWEPRVWCAMIYMADSRDVAGAVRRSKRLHWKQEDARREVERWVTEMALAPVRWQIADDETLVGRIPGRFVVVKGLLLPLGERA